MVAHGSRAEGPLLPPQPTEFQWRQLTAQTIGAYLAPGALQSDPLPSVQQAARGAGFTDYLRPYDVLKAERFAAHGALIRHQTYAYLVRGQGAFAVFKKLQEGGMDDLLGALMDSHQTAFFGALWAGDPYTTGLKRRILDIDPVGDTSLSFISQGGAGTLETYNFNKTVPEVLDRNDETKNMSPSERTATAHLLVPLALGRAAVHGQTLPHRPTLRRLANQLTVKKLVANDVRATVWRLLRNDGKKLFALNEEVEEISGPLLKCPAHMSIGGEETALSLQMHAGVNAAAERGAYNPR